MKKILWLLVAAMVFAFCVTPLSAAPKFTDVKDNDWFAEYVYDLAGKGIIRGMTETTFVPNGSITRAQFARILAAASGENISAYAGKASFGDVSASAWYASSVQWAYEKGVVYGTTETTFAPDAKITRQQMATMIYRYADYKNLTLPQEVTRTVFKDEGNIASWAKDAVAAMQQANIIGGYPDGTFLPNNNATRAEASTMISVFLTKAKDNYQEFMDKDVNDFEGDRVLNFDESTEDNFAVICDDVELVKDDIQTNDLASSNEETGTYVFTNIDENIKNLQVGDKLMIAGDEYEDCVSLIVDRISINGSTATITTQGGEIEDFFDYIQLDKEIPITREYLDTSTLPEGVTLKNDATGGMSLSGVNFDEEASSVFNYGMDYQSGGVKASGDVTVKITVNAVVNWDPKLFGKDYLQCDMKATLENSNNIVVEFTESADAGNTVEVPIANLNLPLGTTGLFITGDLNFIIDFDGSLKAEITSSATKTSGFTYNTNAGFHKIDEMTTKELETVVKAEGTVSGGIEAGLALSLVKVVEAKISAEAGIEAKAEADLTGVDTGHTCFLCFDGELYKYAQGKFEVTAGVGKFSATPVNWTIARWEDKIDDFYCSLGNEHSSFSFGWGNCPNRSGDDPDDDNPGGGDPVASGTCGENLTWILDKNGTLTISGTGAMTDWDYSSDVPWDSQCSDIKKVVIKKGVTTIGNSAFENCYALTSVTIPNSVTTIGNEVFYHCYELTSVTIPNSVTTIGDSAFVGCNALTSVTLPNSITTIGNSAFWSCDALTSVTIPNSVTTIGDEAFKFCYTLTSVTIPNSVTTIGDSAFNSCYELTSVTIPNSVTTIGDRAFGDCYELTSVTIPNSVTTIGNGVFYHCDALTSVTIPDSVTTIGDDAFYDCNALTSVTMGNNVTTIGNSAFGECYALTDVTIPNSVTTIGDYAFMFCYALTDVTIPNSVTAIGDRAFLWCDALTNVYYQGSEADKAKIDIGGSNDELLGATWHYNS